MQSKVGLDFEKVRLAKSLAEKVAVEVQAFVERYTTVATERTIARALGIDGVDESAVPLPNVLVEQLKEKGVLSQGVILLKRLQMRAMTSQKKPRSQILSSFSR